MGAHEEIVKYQESCRQVRRKLQETVRGIKKFIRKVKELQIRSVSN